MRAFARDLEAQRTAIMQYVAPTKPAEALDLLWQLLDMAPSLYERCDDSNGRIGDIMAEACENLGEVARSARLPADKLADRVFTSVCANDYAQFDGLIKEMAGALGDQLARDDLRGRPVSKHHARLVRSALIEIADVLGDVDDYAARFTPAEQTNPAIAADIAARLLAAGSASDAMVAIARADNDQPPGRSWPEWEKVRIEALEALGQSGDAQQARWAIFERDLNADYLQAHLKGVLEEAEARAISYARGHPGFHQALAFLTSWPAHDAAALHVLERHHELDGDFYWLLTPAAEALEQRHPLAATLMLRAMISFSLDKAKSKRYGHAARHLRTCEYLARRIDGWGAHSDHDAWVADLKLRHARKAAFWQA